MAKESALARLPFPAKLGIIVAALATVGVAYWVVFYGDVAQSITSAQRKEADLKKKLAGAKKVRAAYNKDLAELRKREERKGEVEKVLPSEAQYPSFLSSVQSVATLSGVNLKAWHPENEVPEEFYARVPMKLEMNGRFHQIARFFQNVGQLDRIINMENISIQNPQIVDDEVIIDCVVLATAFRSLAEEEAEPKKKKATRRRR